jgi:fatty acid desaturase
MLDTHTQTSRRWLSDEPNVHERLNWYIAANRYEDYRRRLFRNGEEEEQMRLMRRPLATERAYALFGLLLGGLPSAAILYRFLSYAAPRNTPDFNLLLFFCLAVNVVCMLIGRKVGARVGREIDEIERKSWSRMILLATFNGLCWAVATGGMGGAVVFGIGAIFGALIAIPVGVLAFVLFTLLHRLVARGGMIDARHFWPLACGIVTTIAALLLGR